MVGDEAEKDGSWICFIRRGTGFCSAGNGEPLKHSWQERSDNWQPYEEMYMSTRLERDEG